MRSSGSEPRRDDSPRHPFGEEPVPAWIVDSPPRPPAPRPAGPPPYDWWLLAVLSWVLAPLAGIVALLMVLVSGDLRLWHWWLTIAGLLVLGCAASVVPLTSKVRPGWTGTHTIALIGFILTAMSSCWCVACLGFGRDAAEVVVREAEQPIPVASPNGRCRGEGCEEPKTLRLSGS
jgi:hypothetical protein